MFVQWGNGNFAIGDELLRGPNVRAITLMYNDRRHLRSEPLEIGDNIHADFVQIWWRWPMFDGLHLSRYHLRHDQI